MRLSEKHILISSNDVFQKQNAVMLFDSAAVSWLQMNSE